MVIDHEKSRFLGLNMHPMEKSCGDIKCPKRLSETFSGLGSLLEGFANNLWLKNVHTQNAKIGFFCRFFLIPHQQDENASTKIKFG